MIKIRSVVNKNVRNSFTKKERKLFNAIVSTDSKACLNDVLRRSELDIKTMYEVAGNMILKGVIVEFE